MIELLREVGLCVDAPLHDSAKFSMFMFLTIYIAPIRML